MSNQSEKLNPFHRLFKFSSIYQAVQRLLIRKSSLRFLYQEFPQIQETDHVLDLGCGPAKLRGWITAEKYVGIDFNASHINEARKNHPHDTFICGNIVNYRFERKKFDKILMMGVLHHLNDSQVKAVLLSCQKILTSQGKIIAVDPVIEKKQNPLARFLACMDQGNHVRTREEYKQLIKPFFNRIDTTTRNNLLRVPYSHHLMIIQQ